MGQHDEGLNYPDGLDETAIDALMAEVDAELLNMAAPTSRLLGGVAAVRWERREVTRLTRQTVQVLRIQGTPVPTGTEAA